MVKSNDKKQQSHTIQRIVAKKKYQKIRLIVGESNINFNIDVNGYIVFHSKEDKGSEIDRLIALLYQDSSVLSNTWLQVQIEDSNENTDTEQIENNVNRFLTEYEILFNITDVESSYIQSVFNIDN
jgi:hypothetical protein